MAVGGIGIATTLREQREGRRADTDGDPLASVAAADARVAAGEFDLLAVGRMLLRDPGFAGSVLEG